MATDFLDHLLINLVVMGLFTCCGVKTMIAVESGEASIMTHSLDNITENVDTCWPIKKP